MSVQFSVLASGSQGNASLLTAGGAGLLLDVGIGPRSIAHRLASIGSCWDRVAAAILTHTHGDHVGDASLRYLARKGIPFYCHDGHHSELNRFSGFRDLGQKGLLRTYDDRPFLAPSGVRVEPVTLSHDGGPTFGFRFEGRGDRRKKPVAIGYLADTGCWWDEVADAMADVDVLGVEFNHDVEMQLNSGRSRALIARNLGDRGHLSNEQGSALVGAILRRSGQGAVRHVVLLHLSEECNRPEIAFAAAFDTVKNAGRRTAIHVARQWSVFPDIRFTAARRNAAEVVTESPPEAA